MRFLAVNFGPESERLWMASETDVLDEVLELGGRPGLCSTTPQKLVKLQPVGQPVGAQGWIAWQKI